MNSSHANFQNQLLLVYLNEQFSLTPKKLALITDKYPDLQEAISDNFQKLNSLNLKWLKNWDPKINLQTEIQNLSDKLGRYSISFISINDAEYPKSLLILDDYPLVLFYQGNLNLLKSTEIITVVGSRNSSSYGDLIIEKILRPICRLGISVVSGLAVGIDAKAHQTAINSGSQTIGVVGSSLDAESFYPRENLGLKKQIIENDGLIISEYLPETKATTYSFPRRNRILAALTELTWVIEASSKSGSLITASLARDLGKTVVSTPGSIFEPRLSGNLKLIKDGASIASEPEDILQLMGLKAVFKKEIKIDEIKFSNEIEEKIYKLLNLPGVHIEILSESLNLNISQLTSVLTMMELSGFAINMGENMWRRSG